MRTRRLTAILALLAATLVAAGCGDDHDTGAASGNTTDAAFITDMSAHHESAIEMAELAKTRAQHPEIRQLADDIVKAQRSEISMMETIGRDMHGTGDHGDAHMGMSDAEMGMHMDPASLKTAKPFDRAFIDMMIPHHEGAVTMAEQLLEKGEQPELRKMAQEIIDAQTKEIEQMREWRAKWYG